MLKWCMVVGEADQKNANKVILNLELGGGRLEEANRARLEENFAKVCQSPYTF